SHNLFSVGQFYDSDLEVAFRRNACFIRNLERVDLLKGNDLVAGLPKFKYHKEHLCPSCEQGKSKRASHPPKPVPNSRQRLHLLHMNLCRPMRIASINGKRYALVIVDDYSHYTWVHFLRSKDEAPENDHEDIRKLGAKGDIGFFIGYSADSCAYRVYNRRTKKIIETMNVSFDELSAMDFEQRSLKPRLNGMTSGHISSGLDLTYAPSTISSQQPSEGELDLLFKAMYDDYFGGQLSATVRTVPPALEPQDVDELNPNAMIDDNMFVNPFANPSTSAVAASSSQNVDPSNMHTFYQPYPHEFLWTKDHPLEHVIGEPSRPVVIRNQLQSNGDMCTYALSVSTIEPKNVKEAMTDPAWTDSMQEELLQIFLAYAAHKSFTVFQMDVKTAFCMVL
nr:hypothetical protein [Tanacetum cinerariifolium]